MARRDMVREVRARVERELLDEWPTGARSAAEISRVLAALAEGLNEVLVGVDEVVARLTTEVDASREQIAVVGCKWAELGLFGLITGGSDSLFDAHAINLQELYVRITRIEAWISPIRSSRKSRPRSRPQVYRRRDCLDDAGGAAPRGKRHRRATKVRRGAAGRLLSSPGVEPPMPVTHRVSQRYNVVNSPSNDPVLIRFLMECADSQIVLAEPATEETDIRQAL